MKIFSGSSVLLGSLLLSSFFFSCSKNTEKEKGDSLTISDVLEFDTLLISNAANQWFARALADFTGDGLLDVVFINQAGFGGELGILIGSRDQNWKIDWVADVAPNGGTFSCGDIDIADIDGDGKIDILAPQNNGEWTDKPKEQTFFWYSYPEKEAHFIGKTSQYIKDVSVVDLNKDGKPDLAGLSFDGSYLVIFEQVGPDEWKVIKENPGVNLHEGMDTGDIDGDGYVDIAATGYWLRNPGGDISGDWFFLEIDSLWHNQSGDWSRNATKHFCADIDNDGKSEVFISHSERAGYPVAYYRLLDAELNSWEKHIIVDTLPAAHTLQVFDMDNDGDPDVVTGVNKNRAINIGVEEWPVIIAFNEGNGAWRQQTVDLKGIYNGHVSDFEGDGDMDIFRLISHDDNTYELLLNQTK
jgi:hypothetical protein